MEGQVTVFWAFVFGLLSFVTPCVLPLVPAYLSYISGLSLGELETRDRRGATIRVLIGSVLFVLGFSVVFVAMGAAATSIGQFLAIHKIWIARVGGVLIVLFGVHMIVKFRFLSGEKRFDYQNKKLTFISAFLMGLAFAFGWTPCIGPILAAILVVAANEETTMQGIILLSAYSLGLGIPFILSGLFLNSFYGFFDRIKYHFRKIEIIGGGLLVIAGILIGLGWLQAMVGYLGFEDF